VLCPQNGHAAEYNRSLFQPLMGQIRYSPDQPNFSFDQRIQAGLTTEKQRIRAGSENSEMWSRVSVRSLAGGRG
jgi:hypothetical protein